MNTIYIVWALLLLSSSPVFSAEINCLQCHEDLTKGKSVHAAVSMGCATCHSAIDAADVPHRKTNKIAKGLSMEQPDLCYTCHDKKLFEKKSLHAPVAGGTCGSCHNPHRSDTPKMLTAAIPNLCFQCHATDTIKKKAIHARAAQGQCLVCHNPHSSENSYILTNLVEEHCESCHDDQRSGKHVMARVSPGDNHPISGKPDPLRPGAKLACASCHNPHASSQRISTKDIKDSSSLCLRCHTKIIVRP